MEWSRDSAHGVVMDTSSIGSSVAAHPLDRLRASCTSSSVFGAAFRPCHRMSLRGGSRCTDAGASHAARFVLLDHSGLDSGDFEWSGSQKITLTA